VHGLLEPRCPECGRGISLQVVAATGGTSAAWLALLITSALSAGIGALVACVSIRERFPDPEREPAIFTVLTFFLLNIPIPLLVLAWRRHFMRYERRNQWLLAGMFFLLTSSMVGWFIVQTLR
jgi:hypothetical protein